MNIIRLIIIILLVLAWTYPFHYAPWAVAENEFFILAIPLVLSINLIKNKKLMSIYSVYNKFFFFFFLFKL